MANRLLARTLKGSLQIIVACALVLVVIISAYHWFERPIKSFCQKLEVGSPIGGALELAKANNFFVPNYTVESRAVTLIINNHMAPYFRVGCFIEVEGGRIVGKKIHSTD